MKKNLILGLILTNISIVSIDFVLNTLIENIGQNQLPKLILFRELLHTAVKTNMNSYGKKKLHIWPEELVL